MFKYKKDRGKKKNKICRIQAFATWKREICYSGFFFFLRDEKGHGDSNSIDLVLLFLK